MSCSRPQRRPSGAVEADLLGEQAGQVGDLDRVLEHVLRIARAELEAAEVVEQLVVQARDVRLLRGLLAELADVLLHLLLGLGDDLLDPGRMDPAVVDQLLQRELGDLAADVVEARDDDDARRVVDDHVDAGGLLEGADVPALAADDPALHVVGGDVDGADGGLGGVAGGVALDGGGEDLAGLLRGASP